jgi:hypothetical protein
MSQAVCVWRRSWIRTPGILALVSVVCQTRVMKFWCRRGVPALEVKTNSSPSLPATSGNSASETFCGSDTRRRAARVLGGPSAYFPHRSGAGGSA